MSQIIVKVYSEGNIYTYSGGQIQDQSLELKIKSSPKTIEAGSVVVRISSDTFVGYSLWEELPEDPLRVLVSFEDDDGEIIDVLNGRVQRSGITHLPSLLTWSLRCVDDSVDRFFSLMEEQAMPTDADYIEMDTSKVASDGGVDVEPARWWDIKDLWDKMIEDLVFVLISYQGVRQFFWLDIEYNDTITTRTISRQLPMYVSYMEGVNQMPPWDGGALFDTLRALLGWRVRGAYADFPSEFLLIEILTDKLPPPFADRPVIDDLELFDDPFAITETRAERPDFGWQYKNDYNGEPTHSTFTSPANTSVYASPSPKLTSDGKGRNRDLLQSKIYLPDTDEFTGNNGEYTGYAPDPDAHPNYTESVNWTIPGVLARDRVYITPIQSIPSEMAYRAVTSREPDDPGPAQTSPTGEHWAEEIIKGFAYSISTRITLSGSIDFRTVADPSTRPIVGDSAYGLNALGYDWILSELSWRVATAEADITLERIEVVPTGVISRPIVCPAVNLRVSLISGGTSPRFLMEWDEPAPGCGQQLPAEYDVLHSLGGGESPQAITTVMALQYDTGTITSGGFGLYIFAVQAKSVAGDLAQMTIVTYQHDDPGEAAP